MNDHPMARKRVYVHKKDVLDQFPEKIPSLEDGLNAPADLINPDYKKQPGNPRKCIECGKTHDTIVENMMTGERMEEISKCKDCVLSGSIRKRERPETPPYLVEWENEVLTEWGGEKIRVHTSNGTVNMVDDLNRREKEDLILRDLINSSANTVSEPIEKPFDPFEEHSCKGGGTETWLVPGGSEFWLIFRGHSQTFTWIEYCPYCGYRPPNLRLDWGNTSIP